MDLKRLYFADDNTAVHPKEFIIMEPKFQNNDIYLRKKKSGKTRNKFILKYTQKDTNILSCNITELAILEHVHLNNDNFNVQSELLYGFSTEAES